MVWDWQSGKITCSVFNTIQVWDASTYTCLNIMGEDRLDTGDIKSSCFFANGHVLVCGTERGFIRLFHLLTGDLLAQARHSSTYICDVVIHGASLLAVDCYGSVQEWRITSEKDRLNYIAAASPTLEATAHHRFHELYRERLLDFNPDIVATNCSRLVVIWQREKPTITARCIDTMGEILCLKTVGPLAYWGEQRGVVRRASMTDGDNDISNDKLITRFQDNVTSIDVTGNFIVIGDVNGEIHGCQLRNFGRNAGHRPDFVIENGHAFGSFVWAVHMDETRIFSGDSDGKLVVHDFLHM